MARISGSLSRLLAATAGQGFAALALAAIASTAAPAGSLNVAMIESFSGNARGLQSMDYVHAGQVIRLNPQQTIVLRYEASCVREMITGGTVTVGIDRSQVLSGEVRRSGGPCDAPKMVLTSAPGEIAIAGRSFRGGPRR